MKGAKQRVITDCGFFNLLRFQRFQRLQRFERLTVYHSPFTVYGLLLTILAASSVPPTCPGLWFHLDLVLSSQLAYYPQKIGSLPVDIPPSSRPVPGQDKSELRLGSAACSVNYDCCLRVGCKSDCCGWKGGKG